MKDKNAVKLNGRTKGKLKMIGDERNNRWGTKWRKSRTIDRNKNAGDMNEERGEITKKNNNEWN